MQDKLFSIEGYFDSAVIQFDAASIRERLVESQNWAANILEFADAKPRIVEYVRSFNRRNPSRVVKQIGKSWIALAPVGKKKSLAYRVEPQADHTTRITPIAFLEPRYKVGIALILLLGFVVPVLFTPLVWHRYAKNNLQLSRYYLVSFCHYLESRLA